MRMVVTISFYLTPFLDRDYLTKRWWEGHSISLQHRTVVHCGKLDASIAIHTHTHYRYYNIQEGDTSYHNFPKNTFKLIFSNFHVQSFVVSQCAVEPDWDMIALVSNSNCVPCISPVILYLDTGSWDIYTTSCQDRVIPCGSRRQDIYIQWPTFV